MLHHRSESASPSSIRVGILNDGFPVQVGRSESYRRMLALVDRFARHERAPILLEGEAGTGKTSLARYIHEHSPRGGRVFHRVDLGTLDDALSSSDLFGHIPGSFTGAGAKRQGHFITANGGTIFLDEIGKASLAVQRRLLHIMEYGEFTSVGADRPVRIDVRIVAATNVSLEALVERGEFLPDLLPRFGFFRVRIPPLRERRADIPHLLESILAARAGYFGYPKGAAPRVHADLMTAMIAAPWSGNVRELAAAVDFLLVAAEGLPELTLAHCEGALDFLSSGVDYADRAREAVRTSGSVAEAARKLGVARTTIYRHLGADAGGERRRGERRAD